MWNWKMRAAGFIGGLAVVFGFVALPAHSDESVTVPVPLVDAMAVSHFESAKRQKEKPGSVILALHAVRRIPQDTVVYYSITVDPLAAGPAELGHLARGASSYSREYSANGAIIDARNHKLYRPIGEEFDCKLCSDDWWKGAPANTAPGHSTLGWFSTPPLPADVSRVDVTVANRIFHDVPVGDGLLGPIIDKEAATGRWNEGMPLGVAWPALDPKDLAGVDVSKFVNALVTTTGDASDASRERVTKESMKIDLDASVLFDLDSDVVKPAGRQIIDRTAKQLVARKVSGKIEVTGYTDSSGSASHNLDLSRRRAASVAKVLGSQLSKGITLVTAGKGEADPVTSNDSEAGRRLNRRVTITVKEG